MEQLQTILIVIMSVAFIILLVLGIAISFVAFKVIKNVRHITQRIDETSENMNQMVKYVGTKVGPAAASAVGSVLLRRVRNSFKKGGK